MVGVEPGIVGGTGSQAICPSREGVMIIPQAMTSQRGAKQGDVTTSRLQKDELEEGETGDPLLRQM